MMTFGLFQVSDSGPHGPLNSNGVIKLARTNWIDILEELRETVNKANQYFVELVHRKKSVHRVRHLIFT